MPFHQITCIVFFLCYTLLSFHVIGQKRTYLPQNPFDYHSPLGSTLLSSWEYTTVPLGFIQRSDLDSLPFVALSRLEHWVFENLDRA